MSWEVIGIICKYTARRTRKGYYRSNLVHIMFGDLFSHNLRSLPMSDCHTCLDTRVHYEGAGAVFGLVHVEKSKHLRGVFVVMSYHVFGQ